MHWLLTSAKVSQDGAMDHIVDLVGSALDDSDHEPVQRDEAQLPKPQSIRNSSI